MNTASYRSISLLAALCLCACDRPERRVSSYPVLVHAFDDNAKPLAGLQLMAAGRALGATEVSGDRLLSLAGTEGERVDLASTCPTGYEGPREKPFLLLKHVRSLQGQGLQPIELSLACTAKEHVSLVAIRTGRPGIPIKLRGQPIAKTSETG
ncbi:MAG TPA: hypothetical protein VGI70_06185, partial [Polyangiales bacterium]